VILRAHERPLDILRRQQHPNAAKKKGAVSWLTSAITPKNCAPCRKSICSSSLPSRSESIASKPNFLTEDAALTFPHGNITT
jgi:hypothetical protein